MLSEAVAFHPDPGQISLSGVFDALSDPVRRMIVARLMEYGELHCSSFRDCGSKTAISYHVARLREAGLTNTRKEGKVHYLTLREADLEQRFPGLIKPLFGSVRSEALASREPTLLIADLLPPKAEKAAAPKAAPAASKTAKKKAAKRVAA